MFVLSEELDQRTCFSPQVTVWPTLLKDFHLVAGTSSFTPVFIGHSCRKRLLLKLSALLLMKGAKAARSE